MRGLDDVELKQRWKALSDPFKADEIEWRVMRAGKTQKGAVWAAVAPYITSRAIMDRLDQVAGPQFWKVEYAFPSAKGVICSLSIYCCGEWLTKQDGAEQTDIESLKGGISGSLKRAAVLWGIGRYLYQLPEGWAEIVERGTRGAIRSKTKEVGEFWWVPPLLPEWALPPKKETTNAKPPSSPAQPAARPAPQTNGSQAPKPQGRAQPAPQQRPQGNAGQPAAQRPQSSGAPFADDPDSFNEWRG